MRNGVRTTPWWTLALVCPALLVFSSACSHPHFGGGYYDDRKPKVTLASVTVPDGTPARVYPSLPIPEPPYPLDFIRAGVAGDAIVRIQVDGNGKVAQATVLKCSQVELGQSALVAIERWRFGGALPAAGTNLVLDCHFKFLLE